MKALVVIANYGYKNRFYIEKLIKRYKSMSFDIDIVLLTNIEKDFKENVNIIVGLSSKNPWSLPFGYKEVFYKNVDYYELFIYSEDDTLIKERNIKAFLEADKILEKDEVAGFIRYEEYPNYGRYYTTFHSHYHWDPNSVKSIGEFTFAYFSNEHSASFILTKEKLKRAIQKTGFMRGPCEGRYDMLCTAATEPYTQGGLKKLICISHIDDFSLHHLPNVYQGKMGISRDMLDFQINRLLEIQKGSFSKESLFEGKTKLSDPTWDKKYYENTRDDLINMLPENIAYILSIGCGWGATEKYIMQKGARVIGIPMDSVVSACVEKRGIKTTTPDFELAYNEIKHKKFDCLLFLNTLEYLENPTKTLKKYLEILKPGGIVIVVLHNLKSLSLLKKKYSSIHSYKNLRYIDDYKLSGIQSIPKKMIKKLLLDAGLINVIIKKYTDSRFKIISRCTGGLLNNILSSHIYLFGQKPHEE